MSNKRKGPVLPPTPSKNQDVKNNQIMKIFNDIKDKERMEIVSRFDIHTFPSVPCKIKK